MSNTYFNLKKEINNKCSFSGVDINHKFELSLTAFVGGENHTQLTVTIDSSAVFQSGTGYIVLSDKDVDNLIGGLLERKNKEITATGNEQSKFCPAE